jgi:ABC-2 type transport system ATP-binding protein
MIEVQGLTKRFGKLTAVDGLSFRVERGDALGFIGPNGAGKTTTIRTLACLLNPDSGTAAINGYDVVKDRDEVRACVGYMPDFFGVYDDMKVTEYLDFFAAAYRVPPGKRPGLIRDVLELTDLGGKRDAYVDTLSRGMKQRLCLAKTLVHDPDVLLLDEPASGLDPRARIEIRDLLKELCAMAKTILISSHILTELADLCPKVVIIEQGRLVYAGSTETVAAQLEGGRRLLIRVAEEVDRACTLLQAQPNIAAVTRAGGLIHALYTGDPDHQHELLAHLVAAGLKVQSFVEQEANLEEVYMQLTRGVAS